MTERSEQGMGQERPLNLSIEQLLVQQAESLGFQETEEMRQARERLVGLEDEEEFRQALTGYQLLGEQEVDKQDNQARPRTQIGLILASSGIYHTKGMREDFKLGLVDASDYALNVGYDDVDARIKEIKLKDFEESLRNGLSDLLELVEMMPDAPLPPDPSSMGFDERALEELEREELEVVRAVLMEELGVDSKKIETPVRTYQTPTPDDIARPFGVVIPKGSPINVTVLETNRSEQGIFLQELTFPDNEKRWVVGPDIDV